MLLGALLAALLELVLALLDFGVATGARQDEREQGDQDERDHDDRDDQSGGHTFPPEWGPSQDSRQTAVPCPRPSTSSRTRSTPTASLPAAEVVAHAAPAGIELARPDRPRHGRRRRRGAAPPRRSTASRSVPAVEMSAVHGEHEDLHILGYGIDHADERPARASCSDFRGDRERADRRDGRRACASSASSSTTRRSRTAARPASRSAARTWPQAVLAHPANAERLRGRGDRDGRDAPRPALPDPRRRGLRRRAAARPCAQAIEVIHAAGGVAVWAHPFWDLDRVDEALATLDAFAAPGSTASRPSTPPTRASRRALLHDRGDRARPADHRLGRLPRPRAQRFNRFCAFELYGLEPNLGPIGARDRR